MVSRFPLDPFPCGWFHVGFTADVAPGAVQPLEAHGRHFVVWRDGNGVPHVLDAFCAHLGAHLGYGGQVCGGMLRCPFHAWGYDGDGRCVEIPYARRMPKQIGLNSHPVLERNGMIWMWWHPHGAAPGFDVPVLPEWSDPTWTDDYVRQHWRVHTQWREIAENGVDLTHFHYLHGVATIPRLEFASVDGPVWHSNATHEVNTRRGRRQGSFEVRFHGPGCGWLRFGIGDLVEVLFLITITPVDAASVDTRFSFLTRRFEDADQNDMAAALIQEVIDQVTDDVPIWEHKIVKDPPRVVQGDGPIMKFRRWAAQFSTEPAAMSHSAATERC